MPPLPGSAGVWPATAYGYAHSIRQFLETIFEVEGGLVEEVRHILSLGFPPASKPFESHGYKQALQLIEGELNPRAALARVAAFLT